MGIDLDVLPIDLEHGSLKISLSRIQLERRRELFGLVEALPARQVDGLRFFGQVGFARQAEDAYGRPFAIVTAEHLLTLRSHEGVTDNPKNRAAWAYIEARGGEYGLYWH